MPIYVYRCTDCTTEIEKRQGFSDAPLTTCESCSGSLRRVVQPAGVIFKGSGWYSTDHRNGAAAKKADADGTSTTPAENGTAAKSESGKPESGKSESGKAESSKVESSAAKPDSGDKKSQPAASGAKSE